MAKIIHIIGGCATKKGVAKRTQNEDDAKIEYWGLNAIHFDWFDDYLWDRWFNLHKYQWLKENHPKVLEKEYSFGIRYPELLFYTVDEWPHRPTGRSILFPRSALEDDRRGWYHAGSFDWLVHYAMQTKPDIIYLHGIQLNLASGEPISARACLEYWCGRAEGVGTQVIADEDCDLFYQYHLVRSRSVYGYDDVELIEDRTHDDAYK